MSAITLPNLHVSNPLNSADPYVYLPALLVAVAVVVFVTFVASRFASGRLRYALDRTGFQPNVGILLARSLWALVWALGVMWVLYLVGVGLTPLTAFVGVLGLAASLSLQQVLQNLVAGVYLLAERPFAIDDTITVVGPAGLNHEGRVEDIQMRTTHLRSRDDELILVPNSAIFGGVVTNHTAIGGYVQHVDITFPRTADLATTRAQILPVVQAVRAILSDPPPQLRVEKASRESWTGCLTYWTSDPAVPSDVIWALTRALPDATVNDGDVAS